MVITDRNKLLKESQEEAARQDLRRLMEAKKEFEETARDMWRSLGYSYNFLKCSKCGREILVDYVINGTDHTMGITATCKDCLKQSGLSEEFIKARPEATKQIQEWLSKP